jgi:hypothetical protein
MIQSSQGSHVPATIEALYRKLPSTKVNLALIEWNRLYKEQTIDWVYKKLNHYNIGVSMDGYFIDRNTTPCLRIHNNNLKCMLRRDYMGDQLFSSHGLKGKALEVMLDYMLKALLQACSTALKDPTCERVTANVLDQYL